MRTSRSAFLVAALVIDSRFGRRRPCPGDSVRPRGRLPLPRHHRQRGVLPLADQRARGLSRARVHLGTDGKTDGFPVLDHLRIDGSDLGVGPAGSLSLDAGLTGAYRLRLSYRHLDQFSALAGFANPLGAPIGQHTWDRTRNMVDVNLELLPGAVVTPLFGYTSNNLSGPGYTTTFMGQDEFRLAQDLKVHDQEFRAGLGFHAGAFSGEFLQGWRRYRETEKDTLLPGAGAGNNKGTVLDKDITLSSLTRSSVTDVNTPTSSFFLRGFADRRHPAHRLLRARERGRGQHGPGGSQRLARVVSAGEVLHRPHRQLFVPRPEHDVARGRARRVSRARRPRRDGRLRHRDATWDGQDLVTSLFTGTSSFTGVTLADIQTILNAQTSVERTEDVFDVQVAAKALGPFGVRAGYSRIEQDLTVTQDPSEIVVRAARAELHAQHQSRRGRSHLRDGPLLRGRQASWTDADQAVLAPITSPQPRARRVDLERLLVAHGRRDRVVDRRGERRARHQLQGSSRLYTADSTLTPIKDLRAHGAYSKCRPTTGFRSGHRRTSRC